MRLYRDDRLIGSRHASVADFLVPAAAASYKLTYIDATAAVLPISTRTQTTWTFRSAALRGVGGVRIPLLLVSYNLPLNLDNHPDGRTAGFSVARVAGTARARVTGLTVWTSLNDGQTWRRAPAHQAGSGRYTARFPRVTPGQAVSLRVRATDAGGSSIDQTIMTAYRG